MASKNLYKKFDQSTQEGTTGGYKNVVFFAPVDTFTDIALPTTTPAALGDKYKISTAHTFPTDEGFISMLCKLHSVVVTGETVGEDGANEVMFKAVFTLLGDGAMTQEQVLGLLNASNIWLLKDAECHAGTYVQLGNECKPAETKVSFDSKSTKEGMKEYTLELSSKAKYFYSATVTEKPAAA